MNKKLLALGIAAALTVMAIGAMTGCGGGNDANADIVAAISREDGSGTRGAFDELVTSSDGTAIEDALEANGALASNVSVENTTAGVISNVSRSYGILGYASLGSYLENTEKVQAVNVNGVEATTANVLNGSYALSRPFVICYKSYDAMSDLAKNFISFIESTEGQEIVGTDYINVPSVLEEATAYVPYAGTETRLTITGSTSVAPLMKVLAAAFSEANEGKSFSITITESGSGAGIADAQNGRCDFGMASRSLKTTELETLTEHQIATDGIAVIVKKGSGLTNVTFDQLYNLYVNGTAIPVGSEN